MLASWTRSMVMASIRSQTPVSVMGKASMTKPGLTPVPRTATRALRACASIIRARRLFARDG